jgi:hypothetical protein
MLETMPSPEPKKNIALTEDVFEASERVAAESPKEQFRDLVDASAKTAKRSALGYASWVVGMIGGENDIAVPQEAGAEALSGDSSHSLRDAFGPLHMGLQIIGSGLSLPKEPKDVDRALEKVALQYAFKTARAYQDMVGQGELPEQAAEKLKLPSGFDMRGFVERLRRLPPGVAEGALFKEPHDIS